MELGVAVLTLPVTMERTTWTVWNECLLSQSPWHQLMIRTLLTGPMIQLLDILPEGLAKTMEMGIRKRINSEISAPGQYNSSEGCVSSGGCSNFLGGDASQNTYTGRGSGTSYAAPAVTGIVALIWEANENLTPLQIKEILKHTSELRGEASAPEVDPYWNREFGYGMVDALAAVELAIFLRESGQTPLIDPTLQSHRLNLSSDGKINMTGHAWGQAGSIAE